MFSNPERIFGDGREIAVTLRTAIFVGNSPIPSKSLKVALEEVAAFVRRGEREVTFDGLANRAVSEENPASRARPIHSCSSPGSRKQCAIKSEVSQP